MFNSTIPINVSIDTQTEIMSECMSKGKYSIECLYRLICPQMNSYFIKTGIILICTYIIISWLKYWFFNHGYKKYDSNYWTYEKRMYCNMFIQDRFLMMFIIYIVIVVWFNL